MERVRSRGFAMNNSGCRAHWGIGAVGKTLLHVSRHVPGVAVLGRFRRVGSLGIAVCEPGLGSCEIDRNSVRERMEEQGLHFVYNTEKA